MNFMGSSRERGGGFNYEEDPPRGGTTRPFSPNSSSSSSSQHHHQKGHGVPLSSYHHHQHLLLHQQQNRWNIGGGVNCQLELMMDSSSSPTNFNTDSSSEDHNNLLIRPQQEVQVQVQGQGGGGEVVEREHMFDKVVTPSDVGKLNRLVIPKQYAEKYFPLDSSTNEKGLLLNFEDRNGKPWRFRYSYWNSSQSYVMTKGWSRFVKDKKLDAGDIVSFQRGLAELSKDRLFIDWRRRPDHSPNHPLSFHPWNHPYYLHPSRDPASFLAHQSHLKNYATYSSGSGSVLYLRSAPAAVAAGPQPMQFQRGNSTNGEPMVYESMPVVQGKAAAKRLRLFGVNMDCPIPESDDQCDILSSTAVPMASVNPTLQLNKGKSSMSLDFDDVSGKDPFCYFNNISAKEY